MAVLVDPPIWPAHGRTWSHLVSDTSLAELHDFAARLGIPSRVFEGDHYDIPQERYEGVVAAGAIPVSGRELLRRLEASGLRRQKRRGEKVLASTVEGTAGTRIDTLESAIVPVGPTELVHLVLRWSDQIVVLVRAGGVHLPTSPATGDARATAEALIESLIGAGTPRPPAVQLGYLRHVLGRRTAGFEAVLAARLPDSSEPPPLHGPDLRWRSAADAVAALPVTLAPLILALDRARPAGSVPPGTHDLPH